MALIEVDKLLALFGDWYVEEGPEEGFIGTIKNLIETVPTIEQQHWIPCSERLPEESQDVLVCTKYQGITDGMHKCGTWWIAWGERCYEDEENLILAWMPLPEPWRGESNDRT